MRAALVVAVALSFLLVPALAIAAPCPAGFEPNLAMKAPSKLAAGRVGGISVGKNEDAWAGADTYSARLEMLDEVGAVFFADDLPQNQLWDLTHGLTRRAYGVWLESGDRYALLRLGISQAYYQDGPPFVSGICEAVVEQRVDAAPPMHPRLALEEVGYGAAVRITHPRGCDLAPILPVVLRLRHGSRVAKFTLADSCDDRREGWRRKGHVTGISFRGSRPEDRERRLTLSPTSRRRSTKPYELTLSYDGRKVLRRWAGIVAYRAPARRIRQGTDAFWNYCLRKNKDVRSSDGVLYCVKPGRAVRLGIYLQKRNPQSRERKRSGPDSGEHRFDSPGS